MVCAKFNVNSSNRFLRNINLDKSSRPRDQLSHTAIVGKSLNNKRDLNTFLSGPDFLKLESEEARPGDRKYILTCSGRGR